MEPILVVIRTEFKYRVTDRLQNSFYINTIGDKIKGGHSNVDDDHEKHQGMSSDFPDKNTAFEFNGISNAFKYNLLSPFNRIDLVILGLHFMFNRLIQQ